MKIETVTDFTYRRKWISNLTFHIVWPIWLKLGTAPHITLLLNCHFVEKNHCSESHRLLRGVHLNFSLISNIFLHSIWRNYVTGNIHNHFSSDCQLHGKRRSESHPPLTCVNKFLSELSTFTAKFRLPFDKTALHIWCWALVSFVTIGTGEAVLFLWHAALLVASSSN